MKFITGIESLGIESIRLLNKHCPFKSTPRRKETDTTSLLHSNHPGDMSDTTGNLTQGIEMDESPTPETVTVCTMFIFGMKIYL